MLKIMRQHAKSPIIKIILYAVIVSFIATIFLIWGRGREGIGGDNPNVVVSIGNEEITSQEFQRIFRIQLNNQKEALNQNIDEKMLKQFVGSQTLSILINQRLILSEAHKRGLEVSPKEIMDYIMAKYPIFQDNGKFIGLKKYHEILQANRIVESEFENSIKEELIMQKFQNLLLSNAFVYPDEVWQEYKKENEKVKIDYIYVGKKDYIEEVNATAKELKNYFQEKKQQYLIPEKRKIEYVLISPEELKHKIEVTKEEIERYYEQNKSLFLVPEERRASHILLRLAEDASPDIIEQTEKKAEDIFKKAQAGEDFAELAKKYSEDEATAKEGGDLGFFQQGRMVPEFDSTVFSMSLGEISEPVKSQFGFHIIKLIDIRSPHFKPIDDIEVQTRIKKDLSETKSNQEADTIAQKIAELGKEKGELALAAKSYSLEAKESAFFSQKESVAEIPNSFAITENAFQLKVGKVSSPILLSNGYAVIKLLEKKDSYMPKFDEAKDDVEKDFRIEGSERIAQQKIHTIKEKLKSPELLEIIAEENHLEVKSTDLFTYDQHISQLGNSSQFFNEAFALQSNQVSKVMPLDNGYVIFRVEEKIEAKVSEFQEKKEELRAQLLYQKQVNLLSQILTNLREKRKIHINKELFTELIS
jgi:peptidyl-prolyl cis-trans isomerase D